MMSKVIHLQRRQWHLYSSGEEREEVSMYTVCGWQPAIIMNNKRPAKAVHLSVSLKIVFINATHII